MGGDHLVREFADLQPLPARPQQVVRELAAVAVRDAREHVFPVVAGLELDLGDAREVLAQ
jgi:hypothetical protein